MHWVGDMEIWKDGLESLCETRQWRWDYGALWFSRVLVGERDLQKFPFYKVAIIMIHDRDFTGRMTTWPVMQTHIIVSHSQTLLFQLSYHT